MMERTPLERRVLAGKVNFHDAIEFAEKNGLPKETWDDLQEATKEIYAHVVPKMPGTPGQFH